MTAVHVAEGALLWLGWSLAIGWLAQGVTGLIGMARLPDLTQIGGALPELPADNGPDMTVIVPACNEEEAIEATLRSLLVSTGLRLEIVAVDDRSTDRTGERMDRIVAEAGGGAHELAVIHNRELPEGWMGKPHALQLGLQRSQAPWVLLTDGDVSFAPEALGLALRYAMAERADHLVLIPTLLRESMGEAAIQGNVQALAQWLVRLWKVRDKRARDSVGVGGFTMIQREALAGVGGLERLRMEVIEDVSLGYLVKAAGYRSFVALGPGLVKIRWIRGVFGIVGNLEKNGFAGFRYKLRVAAAVLLGLALQAAVPLAVLGMGRSGQAAGLMAYLGISMTLLGNRKLNGVSPLATLLFAPCALVVGWALVRSVVVTMARDGVDWRGTHYPLSELRRNAVRWKYMS